MTGFSDSASSLVRTAWWVFVVLAVMVVLLALALLVLRLSFDALEKRSQRRAAAVRTQLFTFLFSDGEEADEARARLRALRGPSWDFVEEQAFLLLPKLRGEAREQLVRLLRAKGALAHTLSLSRSLSAVRRCRGAFGLGVIGGQEHVPRLVEMLDDKTFLVRRVAVRALGNLRAADGVVPLLHTVGGEARLSRDLVYALDRIGLPGAPMLRDEVAAALTDPEGGHHADVAARALGLIDDLGAVPLLIRVLEADVDPPLARSAAESLGMIGSPEAVPALTAALLHDSDLIRQAATRALGEMGSPLAIDSLLELVELDDPLVSRDAANALQGLGQGGIHVLERSTSPYARESMALARLAERR